MQQLQNFNEDEGKDNGPVNNVRARYGRTTDGSLRLFFELDGKTEMAYLMPDGSMDPSSFNKYGNSIMKRLMGDKDYQEWHLINATGGNSRF